MGAAELALVGLAALVAGGLNAAAGGGSLLLFPTLLAVGLPPLAANVTTTVSIWPGYVGTALGYRSELRGQRRRVLVLSLTALLGGTSGAVLLLTTPESVFSAVVPVLVLFAALLLAVQARVTRWVQKVPGSAGGTGSPLLHVALFLAAVYGGYFGGALGVILLAVLAVFLAGDLQRVNALRAVLSLLVNTVALIAFALFGPVEWVAVAVAAPACLAGGYAGARVARRMPVQALRAVIVVFGVVVGVTLFLV
jgi:uncharacterized membrane protein YfcA